MGLKVFARIKLPYIIRMREAKVISTKLPATKEFSEFTITFYPNLDCYDELYNSQYSENNCFFIEIEAVTGLYHYAMYEVEELSIYTTYNPPEEDQMVIFNMLRNRLNEYLYYIAEKTKMFWIEELMMNPLSGVIGKRTDFVFLHPDRKISGSARYWLSCKDDYQTDLKIPCIKPLDQDIIDEFNETYVVNQIWIEYINKARTSLYSSKYIDFIIYSAIAAESFIKKIVSFIQETKEGKDIVLQKLIDVGKNNFVELYYKIILKYLSGKNLLEVEQTLYDNLRTIYKLRNAIMHQGIIKERDFKEAGLEGIEELNFDLCLDMFNKLQRAINSTLELLTYSMKCNTY